MRKLNKLIYKVVLFIPLMMIFPVTLSFPSKCFEAKDRGYRCLDETKPNIKFYFDKETEQCLAFRYEGCGGNENKFSSLNKCRANCIPHDFGWCALGGIALKDEKDLTMICTTPYSDPCPDEYVCKRLAFFGICCPKKVEDLFEKNINPHCANGKLVTHTNGGLNTTFFGKSCDDKFCPENSKCIQHEVLAHCCQ